MAKGYSIQTNFAGGALDPKLHGRVDLPIYGNSAKTLLNAFVHRTGGAERRPGLRFIDNEGTGASVVIRLIRLGVFRKDLSPPALQYYVIEIKSDNTIDFYTNGAKIAGASIASPYTGLDLLKLRYAQFDSVLYLTHPEKHPQMLKRTSDTVWTIADVPFRLPNAFPTQAALTVSSATYAGGIITVTTAIAHGYYTDEYVKTTGFTPSGYNGTNKITVTGATTFTFTSSDFGVVSALGTAQGVIQLTYSGVNITANMPVSHGYNTGEIISISGATQSAYNGDFAITTPDVPDDKTIVSITRATQTATVTCPSHGYSTGHWVEMSGIIQEEYNGEFQITVTDGNVFTYTVSGSPTTPAVGFMLARKLNPFTFTYTALTAPTSISSGTIASKRLLWGTSGYPSAIAFFEQRMILANTKPQPQTVFGSRVASIYDFKLGETADSDPFEMTVQAASTPINHLVAAKKITAMTLDKEVSIKGSADKALTSTDVLIEEISQYGSREGVEPLLIGSELVYVSRHGGRIRAMSYALDTDGYNSPDINIMSVHLTGASIVRMVYMREPNPLLFCVNSAGQLAVAAYDKDYAINAWSSYTTDGVIKDAVVIPYNDKDWVWVVVQRTIGGTVYNYVEYFDDTLNTDSAITATHAGQATWTGLSHLEGKTVDILADGVVMPSQVVASGQITLPRTAQSVEIGLHYGTTIELLPVEVPTGLGTAQGQAVSVSKVIVRLSNSIGCTVDGDVLPFRKFGADILNENVLPFTGDKEKTRSGWSDRGVVKIEQTQPLPLTVLAVIREVTVNGG